MGFPRASCCLRWVWVGLATDPNPLRQGAPFRILPRLRPCYRISSLKPFHPLDFESGIVPPCSPALWLGGLSNRPILRLQGGSYLCTLQVPKRRFPLRLVTTRHLSPTPFTSAWATLFGRSAKTETPAAS